MVQINFSPATIQTYHEKCNLVRNVNVRALTTLCGLDQPVQFQKLLLSVLEKDALKTSTQINAFIDLAAPHVRGNKLVLQLFQKAALASTLSKNLQAIQKYQNLLSIEEMIKENKLNPDALSTMDKELIDPNSSFTQEILKTQNWFQEPENLYQINYEEMIAKLIEEFLDEIDEKNAEKIKENKEKKYKKIIEEGSLLSDEYFEDELGNIDWEEFRKKVIWPALDRIGKEKTLSNMGFAFGLTLAFQVPFAILQNLHLQILKLYKEQAKKTAENREKHFTNTLKKHGLNKDKLSSLLAEDARDWILDNKNVEHYNSKNNKPKTRKLKRELAKKEFVDNLPRNLKGNLNCKAFTKKQKEKYIKYLEEYAEQFEWRQKACYLTGLFLKNEEKKQIIQDAIKKAFTVDFNLNKKMSSNEILEKIEEIQTKNPHQIQYTFDKDNLLIPVSAEINQLVNNIEKNKTLSKNQINILKQSLIATKKSPIFINNILYFIENNRPIPSRLKNDIFETLASQKIQDPKLALFALRNQVSIQQLAKQAIQCQQNASFIEKWKGQNLPLKNQNQHQLAG